MLSSTTHSVELLMQLSTNQCCVSLTAEGLTEVFVYLSESLKSPASSVKLKRSVDDGLLQSFAKRQRPIPVQQFTEPVTSSPSRAAEEKASDPGGVIQQPKLNEEHIKPHNKRAAMGCGLASIFAAVLDSDEEPDISGMHKRVLCDVRRFPFVSHLEWEGLQCTPQCTTAGLSMTKNRANRNDQRQ